MNIYEYGKGFALIVDHEAYKRRGKWVCSISIGDEYYESDPYQYKVNALSEVLGYLEGIDMQIKAEIEAIKKEMEEPWEKE